LVTRFARKSSALPDYSLNSNDPVKEAESPDSGVSPDLEDSSYDTQVGESSDGSSTGSFADYAGELERRKKKTEAKRRQNVGFRE